MKLLNTSTGEIIKNEDQIIEEFKAKTPEEQSEVLTNVNEARRLLSKIESWIKDYIKDRVNLDDDKLEDTYGNHTVSYQSRFGFYEKDITDEEDIKTYKKLKKKYGKYRSYITIK